MKRLAVLAIGLAAGITLTLDAQEKKGGAPKIAGKYKLVGGKKDGNDLSDESKKASYTIDAKSITISDGEGKFVMSYKLDPSSSPVAIDMEILEAPFPDIKGSKGYGIIELKGDTLKLAYDLEKAKRPKDFAGAKGFSFELKKEQGKK